MSQVSGIQGRLIKWEGDAPKVWKLRARWPFVYRDVPDPVGHPKCLEIVEFGEGRTAQVIYTRKDNATS